MGFLKNVGSYILFVLILLLLSCHPKSTGVCNVELIGFSLSGNTVSLKTKTYKNCKGFKIDLIYDKKPISFYVNFDSKIVNSAPPYGFSVKTPNKDYLSLGVDGNIVERNSPVYLKSNSKIKILKDHILIRWLIKLEDIGKLSKIKLPGITIKHPSNDECRFAYNNHLTTPREKPVFYPFDKFLSFCRTTWITDEKDKPYIEILRLTDTDIKWLQKRGDKALLNFLGFLKQINHSSKDRCNIHILLYDARDYKRLNPRGFRFHLKKLNKETYETTFSKDNIVLNKGVYLISIVSKSRSGKSKVITCKGGEYFVAILVKGGS